MSLKGRNILVGLSGGIACYKVATVVSALAQEGAQITVLMTEGATRFVAPLTFGALSGNAVHTDLWEQTDSSDPQHIRMSRSAELLLIAPCTMDMMSKLVTGRTDDVVSLVASAIDRQRQTVIIAPSMNEVMWNQPANQRNLRQLVEDGYEVVGPGSGWQACRTEGVGRMAEPAELIEAVKKSLAIPRK
ncbi:MAG TPA: flavoprotein [Phycisphaerales bacterium]|nr:flavoprotein [Phycisphaerales bacterium]